MSLAELTNQVVHYPDQHRFELVKDGQVAQLMYMDLGKKTLDIYRTFVPDALRGRDFAAALTEAALVFAEAEGYDVMASCSYTERYLDRRRQQQSRAARSKE